MDDVRTIITVDGLAGTGKTTLSAMLAKELGFVHLSTGILYRAVALFSHREGLAVDDPVGIQRAMSGHEIQLALHQSKSVVTLDGEVLGDDLYTPENSERTSQVAVHEEVRAALVEVQRTAYPGLGLVAEGRDMGTVIFPGALVKFWIETELNTKVERRIEQIVRKEGSPSPERLEEIRRSMKVEIHERDTRDQERALAPTVCSAEMIRIKNTGRSLEEVFQEMLAALPEALRGGGA
ncbi:(d)CMP kinase [bacterium]|nr:(d)CMP kinase [bacterium]